MKWSAQCLRTPSPLACPGNWGSLQMTIACVFLAGAIHNRCLWTFGKSFRPLSIICCEWVRRGWDEAEGEWIVVGEVAGSLLPLSTSVIWMVWGQMGIGGRTPGAPACSRTSSVACDSPCCRLENTWANRDLFSRWRFQTRVWDARELKRNRVGTRTATKGIITGNSAMRIW